MRRLGEQLRESAPEMAEQGGRALLAWTYWVDDPYQGGVTLLSLARVDVSP